MRHTQGWCKLEGMLHLKLSDFSFWEVGKSLREFVGHLGWVGWCLVIGFVGGVVGLSSDANLGLELSRDDWFVVVIVCTLLACFLVFHNMRIERDAALDRKSTISEVAGRLTEIRDSIKAIDWNRRLWITLQSDLAGEDNGFPDELRAQLISLAIWVDKHSRKAMRGEARLAPLISVNRSIMEGLVNAARS